VIDVHATTKTVELDGERFPVVDVGSGPAVLLLHGFPDSRVLWRHQVPALAAAGLRVIAPDLRGFGEAPRPIDVRPYRRPFIVADVLGLLDALGVTCAHLVGHDWGASLAWRLAGSYPERFGRVVVLSVGAPTRAVDATWRYERIAGAGHWMMLDKPEALNRLLIDFLGA
jgi:pimeloyl-ACP methyl ester carboxylesterase